MWKYDALLFQSKFLDSFRLERFCKTRRVLEKTIGLKKRGFKCRNIYSAYLTFYDLLYYPIYYEEFYTKIRELEKTAEIAIFLINILSNIPDKLTRSEDIISRIYSLNPNIKEEDEILNVVNSTLIKECRTPITMEELLKIKSQPFGAINQEHQTSFDSTVYKDGLNKFPLKYNTWIVDLFGFRFFTNENSSTKCISVKLILKSLSGRIIDFSIADWDNQLAIFQTILDSFIKTNCIPNEILLHCSYGFDNQKINSLITRMKNLGINIYPIKIFTNLFDNIRENYLDEIDLKFSTIKPAYAKIKIWESQEKISSKINKSLQVNRFSSREKVEAQIKEIIYKFNSDIEKKGSIINYNNTSPKRLNYGILSNLNELFFKQDFKTNIKR